MWAGLSGVRTPVKAYFPFQTGLEAYPDFYIIDTGAFRGVRGRGVLLTVHPI